MKYVILFADNERGIRKYLKQELETAGFHVILTEDGAETLEVLDRFVVDAVVLDEHMPRCNGLEAAKCIKQQHPDLPVILFTADEDYEQYKSSSVDAVVIKSADLGVLKATIGRLLDPTQNTALASRTTLSPTWTSMELECS